MVCMDGFSVYIPNKKVSIWDIEIEEEMRKKAIQRNGMKYTYNSVHESCADMALKATRQAMKETNVDAKSIDYIIYVSGAEKDYCSWSASAWIQNELEAYNAIAYDLYQGCNSTLMAIEAAVNHFKASDKIEYILITGADKLSAQIKNGFLGGIMMGDAGEAILLKRDTLQFSILTTAFCTDGRFSEMTYALGGASSRIDEDALRKGSHYYQPRDTSQFDLLKKVCIKNYLKVIKQCLDKNKMTIDDINYMVFPNTSKELYEQILDSIEQHASKSSLSEVEKYGHLGCVDGINNLKLAFQEGKINKGDNVILTSMGAGLSWGAVLLQV